MRTLVIIPTFNEQDSIVNVVKKLKINCPGIDYLIVNDGSTDKTKKIIQEHGFTYVDLPMNIGIGGCVQTGYIYARNNDYDIAIQMDADGQHNSEYILTMIKEIKNDTADIVIGSRFIDKEGFQSTFLRRLGIKILYTVAWLFTGAKILDITSGFRACGKEVIHYFADNYAQDFPEPEAIVSAQLEGYRIMEVPVIMEQRMHGKSSISGFKSINYIIKVSMAIIIRSLAMKKRRGN